MTHDFFKFFICNFFLDFNGIGATNRTRRDIECFLYAFFYIICSGLQLLSCALGMLFPLGAKDFLQTHSDRCNHMELLSGKKIQRRFLSGCQGISTEHLQTISDMNLCQVHLVNRATENIFLASLGLLKSRTGCQSEVSKIR